MELLLEETSFGQNLSSDSESRLEGREELQSPTKAIDVQGNGQQNPVRQQAIGRWDRQSEWDSFQVKYTIERETVCKKVGEDSVAAIYLFSSPDVGLI